MLPIPSNLTGNVEYLQPLPDEKESSATNTTYKRSRETDYQQSDALAETQPKKPKTIQTPLSLGGQVLINSILADNLSQTISVEPKRQYPTVRDNPAYGDINSFRAMMNVRVDILEDAEGAVIINATLNDYGIDSGLSPDKNKFEIEVSDSGKYIDLYMAYRSKETTWNSADAFQVMLEVGRKDMIITADPEIIQMSHISSDYNESLANNLEKIRNHESEAQKQVAMETELFTGPHAGRGTLRKLERVGFEPIPDTLEWRNLEEGGGFGRDKPIEPGHTDLRFKVRPLPNPHIAPVQQKLAEEQGFIRNDNL